MKTLIKERSQDGTVVELKAVKKGEFHAYYEYLIELDKESTGKKYYAKIFRLVARGLPCKDPNLALKQSVNFLKFRKEA